jgi:hypothetical protein
MSLIMPSILTYYYRRTISLHADAADTLPLEWKFHWVAVSSSLAAISSLAPARTDHDFADKIAMMPSGWIYFHSTARYYARFRQLSTAKQSIITEYFSLTILKKFLWAPTSHDLQLYWMPSGSARTHEANYFSNFADWDFIDLATLNRMAISLQWLNALSLP